MARGRRAASASFWPIAWAVGAWVFTSSTSLRAEERHAPADDKQSAPAASEKSKQQTTGRGAKPGTDKSGNNEAAKQPKAEDAEPTQVSEKVFDEAVEYYKGYEHTNAAEAFWRYLSGNDATADHYEWAEYYLGQTFKRMGLNQAAVEYLYNVIKEQKRPELLPDALRALEDITAHRPFDHTLVLVDLLNTQDFDNLPPDVKTYVEFHQGTHDLLQGRDKWANRHFDRLARLQSDAPLAKRYAQRAVFTRALTVLKKTHARSSKAMREARREAREMLESVVASDVRDYELKNDAKKDIARLYFEEGDYKKALEVYDSIEVPFLSREEAGLFVEKAWARYYLGDFRGTLGILLSLEAPSYRRYFNPERFILKALAYQGLCHYAAAKGSAREFLRRYGQTLTELKKRRDPLVDPVVRRAAVSGRKTKRVLRFLRALQREREKVDSFSDEHGLRSHLARMYDLKIAEVNRELDILVRDASEKVAEELLDFEEQARLLDYEVSLEVFRRLKKGTGKKTVVDNDPPIPLGSRDVYYRFNGEYWNDELHNYRFRVENRCFGERLFKE